MGNSSATHHHTVRVMTWNIRGAARPDLAKLARAIADVDPDVLALQEVRQSQAVGLAGLLDFPERRWLLKHQPPWPLGMRWAEGIAVLSRFPVRGERHDVLTPGASMRTFRRRVLQQVTLTTAAGSVRIANTHLSSDDDNERAEQAELVVCALAEPLEGADLARTVLLGDLNCDDAPEVVGRLVKAGLTGTQTGPTNPAGAVAQRLDHVMVGSMIAVAEVTVPDDGPQWASRSDHLPVVADLHLS